MATHTDLCKCKKNYVNFTFFFILDINSKCFRYDISDCYRLLRNVNIIWNSKFGYRIDLFTVKLLLQCFKTLV